jgi:hypothetical protein
MHKGGRNDTVTPGGSVAPIRETTLGDYIQRKLRHEAFDVVGAEQQAVADKKLTFDEWYVAQFGNKTMTNYDTYSWVWDAAQENK